MVIFGHIDDYCNFMQDEMWEDDNLDKLKINFCHACSPQSAGNAKLI